MKRYILFVFAIALTQISCIKDEPLENEADIVSCWLEGDVQSRDAEVLNDSITIIVREGTDLSRLAPHFTISKGATMQPASGTVRDFRATQYYTVTSQSGRWSKRYPVRVTDGGLDTTGGVICFNFDNYRLSKSGFHVLYERNTAGEVAFDWASGNDGFAWTGGADTPQGYPTAWSANGRQGGCVCLTTRSTGALGVMAGKPLAAGNIFLGHFDFSQVLVAPLRATCFGIPFRYVPLLLSGWYQYTPGSHYTVYQADSPSGLREVIGMADSCAIYAVFFEVTEVDPCLYGDNVQSPTNANIVALARLEGEQKGATLGWSHFEVPFVLRPGKHIDPDKLRQGGYSLTIVASSSQSGEDFAGAVGSTLMVDQLQIAIR
ncbi:MAG: PCMD domain-containing protein [Bacteroidales bacterium]|nr:PCMD domain-containing protein [Candidatus Colimorpha onthohippi]